MQRKGGDKNGIVVKNLDTINTSVMVNAKILKTAAHATQIWMNWRVSIACPKQRVNRRNKDTAFVQITIHRNKTFQYYGMLCHTWERLRCTGQLLNHSLGSTMTLDAGWTRWWLDTGVNVYVWCISFLHCIRFIFSDTNATVLIHINANVLIPTYYENDDDTYVGLFHECRVKIQNSLVAYIVRKIVESCIV